MGFEASGEPVPASGGPPSDLASFGERLIALIIDALVVGIPLSILLAITGLSQTAGYAINTLVGLAYYVFLEGSPSGQTIGKRVMKIRVVDFATAGSIDYTKAFIRYIGRLISSLPCLLGYFWMLWDKDKQTWHDKIATTHVVKTASHPVEKWPG